jgi:CDP-glycerol glycerophosphotransferase
VVYVWRVAESTEPRNAEDRFSINRDIDEFLERHGTPNLIRQKHVKFLKEDLRADLRNLPSRDPESARQFLALASDYLAAVPAEAVREAGKMYELAEFFIRRGDLDGVLTVVDYLERDRKLSTDLVQREGRVFWTDPGIDDADTGVLDVTSEGFQEVPLSRLHLQSTITHFTVDGTTLNLECRLRNQLGRITGDFDLALTFVPARRTRRTVVPITDVQHQGDHVVWRVSVDIARAARPTGLTDRAWTMSLRTRCGGEVNYSPITTKDTDLQGQRFPVAPRLRLIAGDAVEAYVTRNGNLALRVLAVSPASRKVAKLVNATLLTQRGARLRTRLSSTVRGVRRTAASADTKRQVQHVVLQRLPLRRNRIVFETHMGRSFGDSPRYIYEELRRRGLPYEYVWSYATDVSHFPTGVKLVRRGSWAYHLAVATAGFWVDNQGFPGGMQKRRGTTYLQTWHGTTLKKMGEDTPTFKRLPAEVQARTWEQVARWDYYLARTEYDVQTVYRAFSADAEVLRYGLPRNDLLVTCRGPEEQAKIRAELGLPLDKRIVLYAPTFRETYREGRLEFELKIDLDQFAEALPDTLLLVRTHYLEQLRVPAARHVVARDVSHVPDITPLMLASDVLVTDYSSVMFDFATTRRPIVFFTYDYDEYMHSERGAYFDLEERAPGPLVSTSAELIETLRTVDEWFPDYEKRYDEFVNDYGEYDKGDAARRVVDHVFLGKHE